jgi:transcriptional regulator with XRE-family HTH domain
VVILGRVPSPRLRTVDRDLRRILLTIGDELRHARLNAGLSQSAVARGMDRSESTVSRIETGRTRELTVERLLEHAAVVGLVTRVSLYPAGRPVRDARQLRLEQRFRSVISASWTWLPEVPLPIPGDLRAVDVVIGRDRCRIAVEIITRLGDVQAQFRAALLKQRDGGFDRLVIVIADTHANRRSLRLAMEVIDGSFPISPRAALASLRKGNDPGGNAFIVL